VPLFRTKDKHQDAYNVLLPTNERAKRMGEIMRNVPEKDQRCLNCHTMFEQGDEKLQTEELLREGVSCVGCHGPYTAWIGPHGSFIPAEQDKWRELSREVKQSKYGMTDLWDPVVRTEICASCHVGDTKKGRVLTHEMYAAGHPPLAGFETATFSNGMPPHWQTLREKSPAIQKLLHLDPEKSGLEQTRIVLVGNVAGFREAMNLMTSQAHACVESKDQTKPILDIAQFDCAQCHHDLKRKSWRQERGYPTIPGRPEFRAFSMALLPVAMAHAGADETSVQAFKSKLANLYKALSAKPFGDPGQLEPLAKDLADWANTLAQKLNHDPVKYDKAAAFELLKRIAQTPKEEVPDYDTARQLAWSFRVIYEELLSELQASKAPSDETLKTKLVASRDAIAKPLAELEKGLLLKLPFTSEANQTKDYPADKAKRDMLLAEYAKQRQAVYDKFWPDNLLKQADYGPEEFKKAFAAIREIMAK
jgi:hypothetical protein